MSGSRAGQPENPETTSINVRLTEPFLEDIDAVWKREGFNSRSEFIRHVLRDAVKHPEFSRRALKDVIVAEHKQRTGESEALTRDEVDAMMERRDRRDDG